MGIKKKLYHTRFRARKIPRLGNFWNTEWFPADFFGTVRQNFRDANTEFQTSYAWKLLTSEFFSEHRKVPLKNFRYSEKTIRQCRDTPSYEQNCSKPKNFWSTKGFTYESSWNSEQTLPAANRETRHTYAWIFPILQYFWNTEVFLYELLPFCEVKMFDWIWRNTSLLFYLKVFSIPEFCRNTAVFCYEYFQHSEKWCTRTHMTPDAATAHFNQKLKIKKIHSRVPTNGHNHKINYKIKYRYLSRG